MYIKTPPTSPPSYLLVKVQIPDHLSEPHSIYQMAAEQKAFYPRLRLFQTALSHSWAASYFSFFFFFFFKYNDRVLLQH